MEAVVVPVPERFSTVQVNHAVAAPVQNIEISGRIDQVVTLDLTQKTCNPY
jgi:hypothetical protein